MGRDVSDCDVISMELPKRLLMKNGRLDIID